VILAISAVALLFTGGFFGDSSADNEPMDDGPVHRSKVASAPESGDHHGPRAGVAADAAPTAAAVPTGAPATVPSAEPIPAPKAVGKVVLRVESVPSPAAVEDAATGAHLGDTPYELELPAGAPRPRLRIARAGYLPVEILPPTDRSDTAVVKLRKRPPAKVTATARPGTAVPHGID